MEPKEYAKYLVDKFKPDADWNNEYGHSESQANLKHSKECAKICLDELISTAKSSKSWSIVNYHLEAKTEVDNYEKI